MQQILLAGQPPIQIHLRKSGRARRLSLRVSRLDGRVTLTLPPGVPETEARAFAESRRDWIARHLARQVDLTRPTFGGAIPFEGRMLEIQPARVRAARVEGEALLAPVDPARLASRVAAFLKAAARQRLGDACDHYGRQVERPIGRITLRDTRSRWGSCTSDGNLMFSWRLIMAPPDVLDYVAAHEVAHLVEMNHSPAYWSVVENVCPDYRAPRRWLRDNGQDLHGYSFTS